MTTNTGGPAFPVPPAFMTEQGDISVALEGMTLRDYFAAKAMQATVQAWIINHEYPSTDFEIASNAYRVADAMLEARSKS